MPLNTTRLVSVLERKILRRSADFRTRASRSWVIQPGENYISKPAVYEPGDLERVTAVMSETTFPIELGRLKGGLREHGPTVGYELNNVDLVDGQLIGPGFVHSLTHMRGSLFLEDARQTFDEGVLSCSYLGIKYFGHWLLDDAARYLLAQQFGTPVEVPWKQSDHQLAYSNLLDRHPMTVPHGRFKKLVVFDDFPQNSGKGARFATLRQRMARLGSLGNRRVFIRRGNRGVANRLLENEGRIEAFLQGRGFAIVDPDVCDVETLARAISGAEMVIGVEGSAMSHAIFTIGENATLCCLQPPYRFNNLYKDFCDCLGLTYAIIVGTASPKGFTVDTGALGRLIDRLPVP